MNHQGALGQSSSNASIQDEGNLETTGSVGFLSSSSDLGRIQGIPDSFSGPNFLPHQEPDNIVPSNDGGSGVLRRNLDLNAEYVESNAFTNVKGSLGLSLHEFKADGPEYQCDSHSSDSMAIDSNSHVVDGHGADSSTMGMGFLSCDTHPASHRELLIGESSSSAVQARTPISQAASSQVNASNTLNISAPYAGLENIHQKFEVGIGCGTRPVSNVQQFGEARYGSANNVPVSLQAGIPDTTRPAFDMLHSGHGRQTGRFQSNSHQQTQAIVPFSILPTGHARNSHVHLSSQTPWYNQHDNHPFYSPARTSVGAIPYMQPYMHVPDVIDTLQASPWINIIRPRGVPLPPAYSVMSGGTVANNIPRNIMLGPQTGRGVQTHNLANMSFGDGTANFLGNFASSSHYGSSSHLSNTPTGVPVLNVFEQHMHMSPGVGNQSAAVPASFTMQSGISPFDLNLPPVSQEMYLSTGFGNVRPANQSMIVPRPENQSDVNPGHYSAEAQTALATEVSNTLEHLRNGGSVRVEELLILDYSLLLFILEAHQDNDEEEDESGDGLSEQDIVMHLRHERFQSSAAETSENVEFCCICQEEYADGEDMGVLDCSHNFHFDCIKKWLAIKNDCPICKQIGLAAADAE